MTYEKIQFFNKVLVRVTWFFLIIGLFDHFVAEFLPLPWPTRNLWLLFGLIGIFTDLDAKKAALSAPLPQSIRLPQCCDCRTAVRVSADF